VFVQSVTLDGKDITDKRSICKRTRRRVVVYSERIRSCPHGQGRPGDGHDRRGARISHRSGAMVGYGSNPRFMKKRRRQGRRVHGQQPARGEYFLVAIDGADLEAGRIRRLSGARIAATR